MDKLNIICIDDQREVLAALRQDLKPLQTHCKLEVCEAADEALEVIEDIDARGEAVALIISDHVMPGKSGIRLLIELREDPRFQKTPMLLLTGMATHGETIVAINEARIDRYIEKPWDGDQLLKIAKTLLATHVIAEGLDFREYLPVLDQETLQSHLHRRG